MALSCSQSSLETEVEGSFESRSSKSSQATQQDPHLKQNSKIRLWCHRPEIPALGMCRQGAQKFKAILVLHILV